MFSHQLTSTLLAVLAGVSVAAVPHIKDLGAVTVLSDNDLYGNTTTRTTGAILLPPSTYSLAFDRCAALNETLWSPSTSDFSLGLKNSLAYTAYMNANTGSVPYWVFSPANASTCNAITVNGALNKKHCDEIIPGLCTNSAPISPAGVSDIAEKNQISVSSGAQIFTGFRDFYTFQFRGIRFAAQPARFTFSTLYHGSGNTSALEYGAGCIQGPDPRWPTLNEDCLFLNIWTPYLTANVSESAKRGKKKAVMLWLYGGGNTAGTGTDPEKEGGNAASRGDVVVVTFNYRVGNLGFLPFNDGVHNGNYGISDMLTALRWVNKHIENFGGDPKRITIWGESAGAAGVRALLSAPEADGLIAGAIMQSSPGEFGINTGYAKYLEPKDLYESVTKKVLAESGCGGALDEVECLKGYNATKWSTEAGRTVANSAVRDGTLLPYSGLPLSGPLAKKHNIPIVMGTNRDEVSYIVSQSSTNFTANLQAASNVLGASLLPLANSSFSPERLPGWSTFTEAQKASAVFNATGHLLSQSVFTCLTTALTYSARKNSVFSPVYQFEFNRTYQPSRFTDSARVACGRDVDDPEHTEYYKCHAGEVPFTFGNILQQGWRDRDGLDTKFAQLIVDYWTAFARTGRMAPEKGYLEARGYTGSKAKMEEAGVWSGKKEEVMRLQWGGLGLFGAGDGQVGCHELGQGNEFYEKVDFSGGG